MIGSCLCKSVKFESDKPTLWCAHCHCTMCQASHGAGIVTWVGCQEISVTISDGHQNLCWYDSSEGAQRGFCTQCGSSMFFRSMKWPGELHIARALVSGTLDREPERHSFYDTHVSWMTLQDDLPGKST